MKAREAISWGLLVVCAAGFALLCVKWGSTAQRATSLQHDLDETRDSLQRLRADTEELRIEVKEVAMLYREPMWTHVGNHTVSANGLLEMFTYRGEQKDQVCAHWCARKEAGGACLTSGSDRCLPARDP